MDDQGRCSPTSCKGSEGAIQTLKACGNATCIRICPLVSFFFFFDADRPYFHFYYLVLITKPMMLLTIISMTMTLLLISLHVMSDYMGALGIHHTGRGDLLKKSQF